MQLIRQHIERDGSGTITLKPEDPEDMWYAYNLIQPTDLLRAPALRRITTTSATGSTSSTRLHIPLLIRVRRTDFDPQAATLHVSGQIAAETPHAKIGQFHTLDLELQRNFTLEKSEGWDSVAREVVREACAHGGSQVGAWAVVMQEGRAAVVGLGGERTVVRGRVEVAVPGKRAGRGGHDKGLEKFFQTTMETMLRHVDLAQGLPVLLASPGFTAAGFLAFVMAAAARTGNKVLLAQKGNFLVVHASSGHVHALNEVLQSAEVQHRLKDTRYARETRLMDDFMGMLRKDDGRAWYGPKEVEMAVEKGAVGRGGGVLLISNALFRAQDVATRRRWVTLVDKVRDGEGGEVRVLSSEHESGKRLEGLGGIAAILTFPLEDLGDEDEEEEEGGETALNGAAHTTAEKPVV
ncbi:Translation factor pelota [Lambiella insularis]|nr:Translation factor pelota [Lambiella insularis]